MATRPVFVLHGVGSQKQGTHLAATVGPWVQFLRTHLGPDAVHLTAELRDGDGPAHATLTAKARPGAPSGDERWEIWEAHWAESFYPLATFQVLTWGFAILRDHAWSMVKGLVPILRGAQAAWTTTDFVYQRVPRSRWAIAYDWIVGVPAALLFLPAYFASLLLATVFFLLSQLPLGVVSDKLKRLTVLLTELLVQGPGDMAAIMASDVQSAAIQGRLRALLLSARVYGDTPGRPAERITVVAHSAGATVAFAVLSDPTLWREWARMGATPQSVSLITVGSSLNLAWRVDDKHPIWQHALDARVRWIDLWARYDPVPHGPALDAMRDTVRGSSGDYHSVRVVNHDSPIADHTAYWGNHPEVVSRLVHEITAGSLTLAPAVTAAVADIPRHRKWIGFVGVARIVAAALVIGALVAADLLLASAPIRSLGAAVLGALPDPASGPSTGSGWRWLADLQRSAVAAWLVGAAILGAAGYGVWQIVRLWTINPRLSSKYGRGGS